MLAPLTLGRGSLADILGEVAAVTVRAVSAFDARQLLTDAPVLIAENLGPGWTGGPRLGFFTA